MDQTFKEIANKTRVRTGYFIAFVLLLVASITMLVADRQTRERIDLVDHTNEVLDQIKFISTRIKDIETNTRGYYITGNELFKRRLIGIHQDIDSGISAVQVRTQDNSLQQHHLRELRKLSARKMSRAYDGVNHFTQSRQIDSVLRKTVLLGANDMDSITSVLKDMVDIESDLLVQRTNSMNNNLSGMRATTIAALLVCLLLIVFGFSTYVNENKQRLKAMHRIRAYQETLQHKIDELNLANEELIRIKSIEKFAATGRISRMIAHEVRNPLTNINLATNQIRAEVPEDDDTGTDMLLDMIERNSNRINQLISDLLNSTKFAELQLEPQVFEDIIEETLQDVKDRLAISNLQVSKNWKASAVKVNADKHRLKIALTNIVVNAAESMENPDNKKQLKLNTFIKDQQVILQISDSGKGMNEEDLSKIFEPYFSTKQKGNGLGLTNTQNIILNHGGEIMATSQVGSGTTFSITLPVAKTRN